MTGRLRITWALSFAGSLLSASPSGDIEIILFIALSCPRSAFKPEKNMIGKQADTRTSSEQGIEPLLKAECSRRAEHQRFQIAGRHCDADSLYGLQPKFRGERTRQRSYRRIGDVNHRPIGQPRVDSFAMKTPKRFSRVTVGEIPNKLPQAARPHQTKQNRGARVKQLAEVRGELPQIFNAIKGAEIGECSVKTAFFSQLADFLSGHQVGLHKL